MYGIHKRVLLKNVWWPEDIYFITGNWKKFVIFAAVPNSHSTINCMILLLLYTVYKSKKKIVYVLHLTGQCMGFVVDKLTLDKAFSMDLGCPLLVIFHE